MSCCRRAGQTVAEGSGHSTGYKEKNLANSRWLSKASPQLRFSIRDILCWVGYSCKGQALPHIPHRVFLPLQAVTIAGRYGDSWNSPQKAPWTFCYWQSLRAELACICFFQGCRNKPPWYSPAHAVLPSSVSLARLPWAPRPLQRSSDGFVQ